ncbi:hypothetical protein DFH08DRAFT_824211 [Mycena albidolilacea]|uniref:Uncharacterized protein n=1 Tax=Mycena albidolilacea TaxID=1033008 RepID=A0AAD7EAU6_9AGAR|nr:hypothetical protein DFH08DRAFT_824211 [Mycena albidolilacea]
MGFSISEMPGTAEQPMEINVMDSSWTQAGLVRCFHGLNVLIVDAIKTHSVSIHLGVDLGEIKMDLPEEDFSWSPTLKDQRGAPAFHTSSPPNQNSYNTQAKNSDISRSVVVTVRKVISSCIHVEFKSLAQVAEGIPIRHESEESSTLPRDHSGMSSMVNLTSHSKCTGYMGTSLAQPLHGRVQINPHGALSIPPYTGDEVQYKKQGINGLEDLDLQRLPRLSGWFGNIANGDGGRPRVAVWTVQALIEQSQSINREDSIDWTVKWDLPVWVIKLGARTRS